MTQPCGRQWASIVIALLALSAADAHAQIQILAASGETREGLPVVRPHPDAAAAQAVLTKGYSGRLLRLYALEQKYLQHKTGRAPEPAYLVLSDRQGGFAKVGFDLDGEKKPDAGWVDIHRGARLSGRFGTVDQIFPHELWHVMVRQLAGTPRRGGGNQVHAVGVRSDPVIAFQEGLAEHAQIMAVDDPDALADTALLPGRADLLARANREIDRYAADLQRWWWPVEPSRLRFLLWFGSAEQVQRYHAVKANLFARLPQIPEGGSDSYRAYLLQNIVPGRGDGEPKRAGAVLATDGGVAHLFWKVVTDPALQDHYREDGFYAEFGATRETVTPLENIYLKLFALLYEARPATAAEAIRGWARVHPGDAGDIARVARTALLGQPVPEAPEIWLANDELMTGTSLFDQYRALPRPHTFDANAALPLDWLTVPGIERAVADRLLADAPYPDLDALLASPALAPPQRSRIAAMAVAMERLVAGRQFEEEALELATVLRPYLLRVMMIVLIATAAGALLARLAGVRRAWPAILMSLVATIIVIALAWVITSPAWYRVVAPALVGGVPWAAWRLLQGRGPASAARGVFAWIAAATPSLLLTVRW